METLLNKKYSSELFANLRLATITKSVNARGSLLWVETNILIGRAAKAIFVTPSSPKIRLAGETCLEDLTRGSGILLILANFLHGLICIL